MKPTQIPLQEGKYYHIYNRGNNRETLFYTEANYKYFLKKYDKYLSEYVDTYAYCLLPNHFHLLISVKELKDTPQETSNKKEQTLEQIISFQFRKFLHVMPCPSTFKKTEQEVYFKKVLNAKR